MLSVSLALGLAACGKNGQSTTPTIEIGLDGYWYINGTKTDYKAGGEKGERGDKGDPGEKGSDGIDGTDGKSPVITIGDNGNWFIDGVDTNVKAQGEKGEKGDKGDKGDSGEQGENGSDGIDGTDGKSAYQIWLDNGHEGTETDFLNWLKGADGTQGEKGDKGDPGEQGEKGENGKDGVTYIPCIFCNYDGTKLYEFYFEKGTNAEYAGPTPTKPDEVVDGKTISYVFKGWDKSLDNVQKPTVFTAIFHSPIMITFKNYDGTVLETKEINAGTIPEYTGATPTKPTEVDGSTTIEWTFSGWDKDLKKVYEDTVYTAVFDSPNAFKLIFLNEDGTELYKGYCGKGGKAIYGGETPTKEEVNNDGVITRYTFNGWDKKMTNIQADTTFTAQYESYMAYVCVFKNYDGTFLEEVVVTQNGTATFGGKTPLRSATVNGKNITEYTFKGWDKSVSSIQSPMTFTAQYNVNNYVGYVVTFTDENDEVLLSKGVKEGGDAIYPYIQELVDKYYKYDDNNVTMFTGWQTSPYNITATTTLKVRTSTIPRRQSGEYPQTKVTDDELIRKLRGLTNTDVQGYYSYNGVKYEKSGSDFRVVEPIKWRYLEQYDDGSIKVMASNALAQRCWNNTTSQHEDGSYANNYAKSDIRKWLNNEFLEQAFYYDDSLIQETVVDNSAKSTGYSSNPYACQDTTDKVFLLSYEEATSARYNLDTYESRKRTYDGASCWRWRRSPGDYNDYNARGVDDGGNLNSDYVYSTFGVVPALRISLG